MCQKGDMHARHLERWEGKRIMSQFNLCNCEFNEHFPTGKMSVENEKLINKRYLNNLYHY